MIGSSRVLAGLPRALRDSLLKSYNEIVSNFLERRWEPSELNGGKFSEAAYSIVSGAVNGSFPSRATKPANMLNACRALENAPADTNRVGDRSLRVLIPRVLSVLYEIRNNRGVGHVGGDVDANHMDASAVQAMASWVMAEFVRIFHGLSTSEAQQTIDALVERKTPIIWDTGEVKRILDPRMSAKHQVLLLLHYSTGWVQTDDLLKWIEYSNASAFRNSILMGLHKMRFIEFDPKKGRAQVSPMGVKEVEDKLLNPTAD